MDLNKQKELFSDAYVKAIVHTAGFDLVKPSADIDSVDWTIFSNKGIRPRLDLQLKCTSQIGRYVQGDVIKFPLPKKNYEELIIDTICPRILVVVVIPENVEDWVTQSQNQLILRHCGYWRSLQGFPATQNVDRVTVDIPRSQIFSVEAVQDLMTGIGRIGRR